MQSPDPSSSPVQPTGGSGRVDPAVRLARTGVRALVLAAIVSAIGAVLVAVLAIVGGAGGVTAAAVVLVVVALVLVAFAGFIGGALRAHGGTTTVSSAAAATGTGSVRASRPAEAVTDDEIESARAMFGEGTGPVNPDPSWRN
ncbi:hypothetical protein CLV49_1445 [Labedella gwakjiensis]|uniref:Uncharacterized protein n=1 Tax=Labedella gwakjiensis TaxID=390269 RepID=A0A2P8GV39_9MICO|nr:hypothetical protein [Labedella gwakjiensis]PSL37838.1 hypothetical protein CLV49_1445 [Labedella gwakjiensis]RUQ87590.1 hypothetical protein ELQ93_11975 [Labedella gwakjiensis]